MHHKYVSTQTRSRSVQHVAVLNSRFALIKCDVLQRSALEIYLWCILIYVEDFTISFMYSLKCKEFA